MAPGRAQLRVGQISVRCLGKSTVAKRGKGEIVAQLGGSEDFLDGRPQIVESALGRDPRPPQPPAGGLYGAKTGLAASGSGASTGEEEREVCSLMTCSLYRLAAALTAHKREIRNSPSRQDGKRKEMLTTSILPPGMSPRSPLESSITPSSKCDLSSSPVQSRIQRIIETLLPRPLQ